MNGGHDLGGLHGLGPIDAEVDEPVFHTEWERRVFALTLAAGFLGQWNIDRSRHARERQHPADYLRHSYYENWLAGLERLLVESGLVSAEELGTGHPSNAAERRPDVKPLAAEDVAATLAKGGPSQLDVALPRRFEVGDTVRVVNANPAGHTRAPRYTRGRIGVIHETYGVHVFADRSAHGERQGQHLYNVRFGARSLWGETASAAECVHVDLWEPHLERA